MFHQQISLKKNVNPLSPQTTVPFYIRNCYTWLAADIIVSGSSHITQHVTM